MAANIKLVTATGAVTTNSALLHNLTLTGGADAAVATIRAGGASGTVIAVLGAAAATTVSTGYLGEVACSGGIHVTVTSGTTPSVIVSYS